MRAQTRLRRFRLSPTAMRETGTGHQAAAQSLLSQGEKMKQGTNLQDPRLQSLNEQAYELIMKLAARADSYSREHEGLPRYDRFSYIPDITFDLHGKTGGQFICLPGSSKLRIRVNAELAAAHGQAFIDEIVPHEFGHLVAHLFYGDQIRPHGSEWKFVMSTVLGIRVFHTVHSFAVPRRSEPGARFCCSCPGKVHELSAIRLRRYQQGTRYVCRVCGRVLRPLG